MLLNYFVKIVEDLKLKNAKFENRSAKKYDYV